MNAPLLLPAAEYVLGPLMCDACEHHDGGHHRGWCEDCAPDGVLVGMHCVGARGEACVALGPRLSDGGWLLSSGQKCCEACALEVE